MNVVLLEPEIPYNTGAIGRTCAASGSRLHLIRPLGFDISERAVKRAGLDYWRFLNPAVYDDYARFERENASNGRFFFATTKARNSYADVSYSPGDYIIFGRESAGLPEELLMANKESCVRVPMSEETRSLNLSVSVGIILYEALRQNSFPFLKNEGELHKHSWVDV